jgi:hypothetical protein
MQVFAEVLAGVRRAVFVDRGQHVWQQDWRVTDADTFGVIDESLTGASQIQPGMHLDLDRSTRSKLGVRWTEAHGDIDVQADVEYQPHRYQVLQDGQRNSMSIWHLAWTRNWRYYLNRQVITGLDVEYTNFEYARATPWASQLWYPDANLWLERGEHVVTVDKFTLLGGGDAARVRADLELPLLQSRDVRLHVREIVDAPGFDKRTTYAETRFRFGADVTRAVRFLADLRWAKYDDPVLGLFHGYLDRYAELAWEAGPGIELRLGAGVDPRVIDPPANEFADIGRDLYLYQHGAHANAAQSSFPTFGPALEAAEHALAAERRVQVQAVVHF